MHRIFSSPVCCNYAYRNKTHFSRHGVGDAVSIRVLYASLPAAIKYDAFSGQKPPRDSPEARLLFRHSDARTQTPLRPQKSALQECEKSLIYQSVYRTQNRTRSPLQVLRKMHTPQLPVLSAQSIIPSRYVHTDKATDKHYAAASASIKALLHPCSDTVHIFSAIPLYSNNYAFFVCCGSLSAHLPHSAARKFPCHSK